MKLRALFAGAAVVFVSANAAAQLTCSTSGSDQCDALHYHANVWNPESKQYSEIYGHTTFSTLDACEASKKTEAALNAAALAHLLKSSPRLKTSITKFGGCHCDMTDQRSHANFLDDERRNAMMRRDRELKLTMAEFLLRNEATMDNETVRAYLSGSASLGTSSPYWPREVSFVESKGSQLLDASRTKMMATSVATARSSGVVGASIDLAPVDLDPRLFASEGSVDGDGENASELLFLSGEMAQMSSMLQRVNDSPASGSDDLLEACNQRIQVLTNLGKVAESGGERSRLADAMRNASSDSERAQLLQMLFGPVVASHWAPANPKEMEFQIPSAIAGDPVAVLRDTTGRFSADQRKIALFALLASNSALTETEEIWLSGMIDSSLTR